MKTIRFKNLVQAAGRPENHLAWSAPATDRVLQQAAKKHRVLTIHQQFRGAKKDFGVVGLEPARDAQFLIFPKSLRAFSGRHVVAIRYELFSDAMSLGSIPAGKKSKAKRRAKLGKVVAFEPPPHALTAADAPHKPGAKKSKSKSRRERPAPDPVEKDPIKREIRAALADLSAGRIVKAERRLRGLLTARNRRLSHRGNA